MGGRGASSSRGGTRAGESEFRKRGGNLTYEQWLDAPYRSINGRGGSAFGTNRQHIEQQKKAVEQGRKKLSSVKAPPSKYGEIVISAGENGKAKLFRDFDLTSSGKTVDKISVVINSLGGETVDSRSFSMSDITGAKKYIRRKLKL